MAVTYGFYNALNHDRLYDAIQMSSIFDGIIRDGIFSTIGDHMVVSAPEDGWYVNVGSGRAWFNHTWTLNDTDYPIEPEEAEVVLDRIDAVILEVNAGAEVRANSIKFLKGTPSSEPVKPTLTHNAEVNQYALAYVHIRAGQTTIFQTDVENAIGTDETPFITGLLQQVSIETLLTQWEAEFNTYFTNFQSTSTTEFNNWLATKVAEYTLWYAQMQTDMDADFAEFDAWFQRMKDQLSEDAAGHLQAEIDELAEAAQKGSIVTVTTTDPTLFNRPVTISQTGFDPVTSSFNASGVAYFETVPMVGDVVIEATNGTLTAHGTLNIPYFGRYNTTLEFWEAVLDISTSMTSLYNRQITVTKNSSTIGTTTFDATGHATFSVHSVGTYNVSATDSLSHTYDVDVEVTEETTYAVDLGGEIDGAIVEPTDDITIWLKCANIEDSSITTLADVLANRSLFETLIANSNACKYMARSTSWAVASGLVPTMTSDTTPSGVASASGVYNNKYFAWKAFDKITEDDESCWVANANTNQWLQYEFPNAVCINSIELVNRYSSDSVAQQSPKTFDILASNDGFVSDTHTLYSGTAEKTLSKTVQVFHFDNVNSYKYYRLYVKTNQGNASYIAVVELQFYEADITRNQDAMSLIGKYDYCSDALLSNATWAEAIGNSEYIDYVMNVSVPTMTSDSAPSGVASANAVMQSGNEAYRAFDKNTGTYWHSKSSTSPSRADWLCYKFTEAVCIKYVTLTTNSASPGPKVSKIQGSNDNSTWEDIDDFVDCPNSNFTKYSKFITNNSSYLYYRIYITETNYKSGSYYASTISEMNFYGRASEEVFITKSPIMTSETTPSGECFGSTYLNGGYTWFRSMMSGTNSPTCLLTKTSGNMYWGYKFATPTVINAIQFQEFGDSVAVGLGNLFNHGVLKGSNDNENWTTLLTINQTPVSGKVYYYTFDNSTAYQYYKLDELTCTGANYVQVGKYWKFGVSQAQTNIIHSAANDTIYMMENGSPVVLTTTNSDGDGILDFSQFMDGTYTLYSSVAKDPTNLSNDYSKSIRITKTSYGCTTEAYLMPDTVRTLYWYGKVNDVVDAIAANGWTATASHGYSWSLVSPVHNTNNITGYSGSTANISGVVSKNKFTNLAGKTIKSIITATQQVCYIKLLTTSTDFANGPAEQATVNPASVTNYLYSHTVTSAVSADAYIGIQVSQGPNVVVLYALWYE